MIAGGVRVGESLGQRTALAPHLQRGLELLTIPTSELSSFLIEVTEQNPLLEINYEHPLFSSAYSFNDKSAFTSDSKGHRSSAECDFDRVRSLCASTGLAEYVHMQLSDFARRSLASEYILDALDEDGYFRTSIADVCVECGVSRDEAQQVLNEVRSSTPCGVGASDLRDCLLLQLGGDDGLLPLARSIVIDYLDQIPKGHPGALARKLGVTRAEVVEAIGLIAACDPHPGRAFSSDSLPEFSYPDLVLEETESGFVISVIGSFSPPLLYDKAYLDLLSVRQKNKECGAYLAEKKREADDVLRNIEYRYQTIARLGNYIMKKEFGFFMRRGKGITPLSTKSVADALGIHPTTVTRAVMHKYLSTPFGTYPLKMFFASSYEREDFDGAAGFNERFSSIDVKQRIKGIIEKENRRKPYSDNDIALLLRDAGMEVSRRTVAKYRESLGIPSSSSRKTVLY